ncbi:squalene synthase HpnC [Noviherbaspirillum galbum]|uniref:Squalene synthase HpnC n=1 Tax=Noviherbaspirillum galbum TaxID=2709383 RepID=A0A6B3SPY9_9BURK|nr:squalene synthase HpnC [Noviherbaspirillum galbum]NEX62844.1 squalene synthase HpnC [Noviherbaspirillum galbum]
MSVEHYENFPVASILLPARLRPAVHAIYAFARSADDIADEGDALPSERLAALQSYEAELECITAGAAPALPVFRRLAQVIRGHALPLQPFHDLLSAFRQDVVTTRYATFDELLDYCRRSADPVGRLMLHLYEAVDARALEEADAICTALQLINFWQDVAIDWRKERVYLPQEDLARFGVAEDQIAKGIVDDAWRSLMSFELARARTLMQSGAGLPLRLPGRIGWELRLIVQGGLRIIERIEQADHDVFRRRPVLGTRDWLVLLWRASRMGAGR